MCFLNLPLPCGKPNLTALHCAGDSQVKVTFETDPKESSAYIGAGTRGAAASPGLK